MHKNVSYPARGINLSCLFFFFFPRHLAATNELYLYKVLPTDETPL